MKLVLILTSLLLTSCANYVSQMHGQIDRAEGRKLVRKRKDEFARFRNGTENSLSKRSMGVSTPTTRTANRVSPRIQRQYQNMKKRSRAEDLIDNDDSGSLWTSSGQSGFLFSKNNFRKPGDIIIVEVKDNLKREIAAELLRSSPPQIKPIINEKKADQKEGEKNKTAKTPNPQSQNPEQNKKEDPNMVYDRISSIVIEEINKEHLLLRGRKDVLYKREKRTIEVQVLISRKDISDNDTVDSKSALESSVFVLR